MHKACLIVLLLLSAFSLRASQPQRLLEDQSSALHRQHTADNLLHTTATVPQELLDARALQRARLCVCIRKCLEAQRALFCAQAQQTLLDALIGGAQEQESENADIPIYSCFTKKQLRRYSKEAQELKVRMIGLTMLRAIRERAVNEQKMIYENIVATLTLGN